VNHAHLELIDDGCLEKFRLELYNLLKNDKNSLNNKLVIHALVWITIHVPTLQCLM